MVSDAETAKLRADQQQHQEKLAMEKYKIDQVEGTKRVIAEINAKANDKPAIGVNVSDAMERGILAQGEGIAQAIQQQNVAVLEALQQISAQLAAMAGPRAMEVVMPSGKTYKGVSAPAALQ